ncbi:hypothetical protein [Fulvivirga imtechensis]|nr:hypothetical protein [Fulvivirga imtechensis]
MSDIILQFSLGLIGVICSVLCSVFLQQMSEYGSGQLYGIFARSIVKRGEPSSENRLKYAHLTTDIIVGVFIVALLLLNSGGTIYGWIMVGLIVGCLQFIMWVHLYGENHGRYRVFVMLGLMAQVKTVLLSILMGELYQIMLWDFNGAAKALWQ